MFSRYIVHTIITDNSIPRSLLSSLVSKVSNPEKLVHSVGEVEPGENESPIEYYMIAPRNTILAKPSESAKNETAKAEVLYPFFSSHVSLPIKPGEHIWVTQAGDSKYWVTRVSESDYVEDANYTHSDRRGLPSLPSVNEVEETKPKDGANPPPISKIPSFPNGINFKNRSVEALDPNLTAAKAEEAGIEPGTYVMPGHNGYQAVITGSLEANRLPYEPVPRFTKRPGDLILQGSNNTLISLGTERGYGVGQEINNTLTNANPEADLPRQRNQSDDFTLTEAMGAIDIVAGRGRLTVPAADLVDGDGFADPESPTAPRIVKNEREQFELYNLSGLNEDIAKEGAAIIDVSEGDPDFLSDACRIYMSMHTSPDLLLRNDQAYPQVATGAENTATAVDFVNDTASIIVKSDEIRIVARKDIKGATGTHGSIKIVKEGTEDTDQAVIIMQADGTILIDGPKVIIGGGGLVAGNGEGTQVAVGRGATEPMVLGNLLKAKLEALIDAINEITVPTGTGPSGKPLNAATFTTIKGELSQILSKLGKTL